jgi:prophage antirepressor-like protein
MKHVNTWYYKKVGKRITKKMTKKQAIKLFEEKKVRTVWDDEQEKWYFSIVDVCDVLTDSKDPTAYWRKLKQRLKEEGNETVTNCHALKMQAADCHTVPGTV